VKIKKSLKPPPSISKRFYTHSLPKLPPSLDEKSGPRSPHSADPTCCRSPRLPVERHIKVEMFIFWFTLKSSMVFIMFPQNLGKEVLLMDITTWKYDEIWKTIGGFVEIRDRP